MYLSPKSNGKLLVSFEDGTANREYATHLFARQVMSGKSSRAQIIANIKRSAKPITEATQHAGVGHLLPPSFLCLGGSPRIRDENLVRDTLGLFVKTRTGRTVLDGGALRLQVDCPYAIVELEPVAIVAGGPNASNPQASAIAWGTCAELGHNGHHVAHGMLEPGHFAAALGWKSLGESLALGATWWVPEGEDYNIANDATMTMALTRGDQSVFSEKTTFGEQYQGVVNSAKDRTLREYLISSRASESSVMDLGCAICCGAGIKNDGREVVLKPGDQLTCEIEGVSALSVSFA
jgi:hypothetical protein